MCYDPKILLSVCRIFYFWLVWLVKLNFRGPFLYCTCFTIKSPAASGFWMALFEAFLNTSDCDFFAWLMILIPIFITKIFAKVLTIVMDICLISRFNWVLFLLLYTYISISSGWELWSVNHALIYQNSKLNIFKKMYFWWWSFQKPCKIIWNKYMQNSQITLIVAINYISVNQSYFSHFGLRYILSIFSAVSKFLVTREDIQIVFKSNSISNCVNNRINDLINFAQQIFRNITSFNLYNCYWELLQY